VRSVASGWGRGSIISIDAGVQLSGINRLLEQTQPPGLGETEELSLPHTLTTGPFAGLEVPYKKPLANASHIVYSLIDTWLITHAHLDHVAGFVINTAGLPGTRPKKLAGLPNTIAALKTHVFNNVIWPNLTDENDGAGLVTYMRLVEGGSLALGEGESKGYLEVNDGLAVKVWGVSHGHCIERHSHRGSGSTASVYGRQGSFDLTSHGPSIASLGMGSSMGVFSPSLRSATHHSAHSASTGNNPMLHTFLQQQQQQQQQHREMSASQSGLAASAISTGRAGSVSGAGTPFGESVCVYDSSATFIRDITTGREILVFGDVEPDSISLSPRNRIVWAEAAPKIVSGKLAAIFIECSYDDSQSVDRLYGHLTPRFVDEEMRALVSEVSAVRLELERAHAVATSDAMERGNSSDTRSIADKKRKRHGSDGVGAMLTRRKTSEQVPVLPTSHPSRQIPSRLNTEESISPKTAKMSFIDSLSEIASNSTDSPHLATTTTKSALDDVDLSANSLKVPAYIESLSAAVSPGGTDSPHLATPTAKLSLASFPATPVSGTGDDDDETIEDVADASGVNLPLQGLKVVIIHVKDKLNDGPTVAEIVLEQLRAHESESRTGCEYIVSYSGLSLYL